MYKYLYLTFLFAVYRLSAMEVPAILEVPNGTVKISPDDQKFVNHFVGSAYAGDLNEINVLKNLRPDFITLINAPGIAGRTALFAAIDGYYWSSGDYSCREVFLVLLADGADTKLTYRGKTLRQAIKEGLAKQLGSIDKAYHANLKQFAKEWIDILKKEEKERAAKEASKPVNAIQLEALNQPTEMSSSRAKEDSRKHKHRARKTTEEEKKKNLATAVMASKVINDSKHHSENKAKLVEADLTPEEARYALGYRQGIAAGIAAEAGTHDSHLQCCKIAC